jgi:hypothetical protein
VFAWACLAILGLPKTAQAEAVGELWRGGGFNYPNSVSVNPTDGSCWVADRSNNQVVHLAQDGTQLWRGGGFNYSSSVSVNPTDRSCCVDDTGASNVGAAYLFDGATGG